MYNFRSIQIATKWLTFAWDSSKTPYYSQHPHEHDVVVTFFSGSSYVKVKVTEEVEGNFFVSPGQVINSRKDLGHQVIIRNGLSYFSL